MRRSGERAESKCRVPAGRMLCAGSTLRAAGPPAATRVQTALGEERVALDGWRDRTRCPCVRSTFVGTAT